jgi:hypothetical protein
MDGEFLKRWQLKRTQKYRHVDETHDAISALLIELYCLIVGHGVGRSLRETS